MADLHLSFAMTPYDRMLPLINGEVKPDGITLEYQGMPGQVPGVFYDQLKFQRYDVSEMSMSRRSCSSAPRASRTACCRCSTTASSATRADHPARAPASGRPPGGPQGQAHRDRRLPADDRSLDARHPAARVRRQAGRHDLVPDSWRALQPHRRVRHQAAGRAALCRCRDRHPVHARRDRRGVWLGRSAAASGGHALARADMDIRGNPEFTPLFSDQKAEAARYYKKTGIYPPHHTTAVRESILKEHPWVARSLMEAFEESKRSP